MPSDAAIYVIRSAANTLAIWRARRQSRGIILNTEDLARAARSRWPDFPEQQINAIVSACESRPSIGFAPSHRLPMLRVDQKSRQDGKNGIGRHDQPGQSPLS